MSDRLREVLLAEVVTTESEVRTLVIWISSDQLLENLFLFWDETDYVSFGL